MHGHSQVDFSIMSKQRGKKHSCELNNRHLSTKKQCPHPFAYNILFMQYLQLKIYLMTLTP